MGSHIHRLNEFSDFRSLMSDLEDLGFSSTNGWAFQWDSTTEPSMVEVIIADSAKRALEIYSQYGWFSEDVSLMLSSGQKIGTLQDVFDQLVKQKVIFNANIIYSLELRSEKNLKTGYIPIPRTDPFYITQVLNEYFSNAEERYRVSFTRGSAGWAGSSRGPKFNI